MYKNAVAKSLLAILMFVTFVGCSSCASNTYLFGPGNLFRNKRRSFIKIDVYKQIFLSHTSSTSTTTFSNLNENYEIDLRTSASGFVVGQDRKITLVATSAHVCSIRFGDQLTYFIPHYSPHDFSWILLEKSSFILNDYKGRAYKGIVLKYDFKSDICILGTTPIPVPALVISRQKPLIGEKYYNISSPRGIWEPTLIPLFEGFYLGALKTQQSRNLSYMFSIPAIGGSSGSPILNSYGEVVGVVHSAYRNFSHVCLATTHTQLYRLYRTALQKLLKDYDKYKVIIDIGNI
tara:strand:+ start:10712 stop:11584 length:873 start_codon:yes stop_codon:yes gene_type:complete